jgi:hypothetical protein
MSVIVWQLLPGLESQNVEQHPADALSPLQLFLDLNTTMWHLYQIVFISSPLPGKLIT